MLSILSQAFRRTRPGLRSIRRDKKMDFFLLANQLVNNDGSRPSSDMAAFREDFAKAKHIVVLAGAGVSAESGVPTFRGAGGFWRKWRAPDLASPTAFAENPSLVWEFYHYRREVMATKNPNQAHIAIAECEKRLKKQNRRVVVICLQSDVLNVEMSVKTMTALSAQLWKAKAGCGGMTRPHVVWFGESLDHNVGTSSVVYPAAMFAPQVALRGVPVAEFNTEETDVTSCLGYHFKGPAGTNVPIALARHESEPKE
ncbi:hypothetical protein KUTeg_022708 [Tegillarca granosa]|uniref:Deacetylase sirtuin-type domain-containing protein n=1 Tax=Tegillarca granosa TaxID=220873 RepID=A0ABQ9E5S0_TEGGR|nr:hypothetical protein KUTeg_022708 [Tegillarca granosa]